MPDKSSEANTILHLADQVKEMNAADGHMCMNNIQHTSGITAVISVYNGIKPSHMVLDKLYEWAEKNDTDLKNRIEKMEKDMSWNDENPV